jgi:hypothetical protein
MLGDSWSLWLLDQDTGSLSIVSGYGNWAHRWGHSGFSENSNGDFRREFLGFDPNYLNNKLGLDAVREFDLEKTRKSVQEKILSHRREGGIDREIAREWWDEIVELDCEFDFDVFLDLPSTSVLFGWEDAKYTRHNQQWLDHLTTVTLARVRAVMAAELDAEARTA